MIRDKLAGMLDPNSKLELRLGAPEAKKHSEPMHFMRQHIAAARDMAREATGTAASRLEMAEELEALMSELPMLSPKAERALSRLAQRL
jgi:hypothetical protein